MALHDIAGFVVAGCLLFLAFYTLIRQMGGQTAQFISICLLALTVAIAPGRVVEFYAEKQKVASLENNIAESTATFAALSKKLVEYESTIASKDHDIALLNNKVGKLDSQNNAFKQISLEKVHGLEYIIKEQPFPKDIVVDWAGDYKSWIKSFKVGVPPYISK